MVSQEKEKMSEPAKELYGLLYVIDPGKAKALGRSLDHLLSLRRCSACRSRLEGQTPPAEEQFKEFAECCARQEGFIHWELPLQEIVFRTLLAEGNRPMTLEELHYAVTEKWATPMRPMNISLETLKKILDSDTYYCFNLHQSKQT